MTLANMPKVRTEIAFASSWSATSPTWTDVSSYVRSINVSRGRSSDLDDFNAGSMTVTLDNRDGRFNPINASSPYAGQLTPRRPIRVLANWPKVAGQSTINDLVNGAVVTVRSGATITDNGLVLNGTTQYADTPDATPLDVTGDLDLRAFIQPTNWAPGAEQAAIAKWDTTRSYILSIINVSSAGRIRLYWSANGSTSLSALSDPHGITSGAWWIRATLDVDNGAGGNTVTFFKSPNGLDWEQVGNPVVTAGTTSIFNSSAPLSLGRYGGSIPAFYFAGTIKRTQVFNGIAGTKVFDAQPDTSYPVFRGYIQGWPQEFPADGRDATTTIQAVDALGLLGGLTVPTDDISARIFTGEVTAPSSWWRLGDTNNALFVDSSGNKRDLLAAGTLQTSSTLIDGLAGNSTVFNGSLSAGGQEYRSGSGASIPFSWSAWIKTTQAGSGSNFAALFTSCIAADQRPLRIGIDASGFLHMTSWDYNPGPFADTRSSVVVNDGNVHHVMITQTGSSVTVYVDGVDRTVVLAAAPGSADGLVTIGRSASTTATGGTDITYIGSMQDVMWWHGTALNSTQVSRIYSAGTGNTAESCGSRFVRLLDSVAWPSVQRRTTAVNGVCQKLFYDGDNALSKLQEVAATEGGLLFAAADGAVVLLDRYYPQSSTSGGTSQVTFGDDTGVGYSGLSFRYDADQLINDTTVTDASDSPFRNRSTSSINTYGQRSQSVSTLLASAQAAEMSAALAVQFADPILRAEPFQVQPQSNPATVWPLMLPLELGYRMTLRYLPLGMASRIVQQMAIQSIQHDITPGEWTVTLHGSPRTIYEFFTLDLSQLDVEVLGY